MPEISSLIDNTARSVSTKIGSPQSNEKNEVATRVFNIFEKKRTVRDQKFEILRDRTVKDYWDDCIKRFTQFKRRPAHKKNWQSNLASATPNEKLISFLSKLATKGMEAKVVTLKRIDPIEFLRERISNALLKAAAVKNDDDFQIILEMLEAFEKGLVIGFEDWYHGKRQIKDIIDQDPETGDLKFELKTIKEWNDVRSSLVNLNDFYPGNVYVRPGKIQDMDDCFLRTVMNEDEFEAEFGSYPDADLVKTNINSLINQSTPFWRQSPDVGNDQVEVIRYFNKKTDEYVVLANEIWINCIGKKTVSPLPWNHKKLPFWGAVFEPFDSDFFYGRSLIDKLISYSDGQDAIFDRILDQMTLAVSKPIVSDGKASSALTKGFLQPNNIITTDWTDGRPNFEVLPIQDPSPVGITLYQLFSQNLDRASVPDQLSMGPKQKKKSATQSAQEQENATEIMSLSLKLMECGIRDKNKLRFPNILQFYSMPVHSKDPEKRFKTVILRNEQLTNGKRGNLEVQISPELNPQQAMARGKQMKDDNEFITVTPEFIRNTEAEIEIVPQSSIKMTQAQRQVLELNFQHTMMELYPDKFDRDAGFEELVMKFEKDPVALKAKQQQSQPGQQGMPGQQMPNMMPQPI